MKTPPPVPPELLSPQPAMPEQPQATSPTPALSPEVEAMIAEAESRGYHRGRNESIARLMSSPADADPTLNQPETNPDEENYSSILILNSFRPSIWD